MTVPNFIDYNKYFPHHSKLANTPAIATIANHKAIGIHNGLKTHHQDQAMTPHSLRTINTIRRTPPMPIPPLLLLLLIIQLLKVQTIECISRLLKIHLPFSYHLKSSICVLQNGCVHKKYTLDVFS